MSRLEDAYGDNQGSCEWTRIDMLLALFDGTLEHIEQALATAESNQESSLHHRIRAISLVSVLRSGLDFQLGELPDRLNRLYEFVQEGLIRGDLEMMRSGHKVLCEVREGFRGIRSKAIELEQAGEIKPLAIESTLDVEC